MIIRICKRPPRPKVGKRTPLKSGGLGDLLCWDLLFTHAGCCIDKTANISLAAKSGSAVLREWRSMHRRANRSTRGAWALFAAHRGNVTSLALEALCSGDGGCDTSALDHAARMVVLGAGTFNPEKEILQICHFIFGVISGKFENEN